MPPAQLRSLQAAAAQDRTNAEYQRLLERFAQVDHRYLNRVNVDNIKHIVSELFSENLIRGRGLFARSTMKAQAASLPFTRVFAALVSVLNTKLPMLGKSLLHRLISQFRRAFKRSDKVRRIIVVSYNVNFYSPFQTVCHSTTRSIAHLVNQGVAHELIALQIVILLERPTDDSIEIAVGFTREVGAFLKEKLTKSQRKGLRTLPRRIERGHHPSGSIHDRSAHAATQGQVQG